MKALTRLLERRPSDEYLKQQLALATYKSKKPDVLSALNNARRSSRAEPTCHHRSGDAWPVGRRAQATLGGRDRSGRTSMKPIWAYEKGFYLKNDHYNGINFAFLLNVRASISTVREAMADVVIAERVRRRVMAMCENLLRNPIKDNQGSRQGADVLGERLAG